jgi:hypothetical protein
VQGILDTAEIEAFAQHTGSTLTRGWPDWAIEVTEAEHATKARLEAKRA